MVLQCTEEALKILMYLQENILGWNFFSAAKMQVRVHSFDFIKSGRRNGFSCVGSVRYFFLKFRKIFCEVSLLCLYRGGCNFTKDDLFIIHTRFLSRSKTFISNAKLKLAKNQAKAKQHPEAELLLFENYWISWSTLSSKIIKAILKNVQKTNTSV